MTRIFNTAMHGNHYEVIVSIWGPETRVHLNWRSGFGGGGRSMTLKTTGDVRGTLETAPAFVVADVLQEAGLDDAAAGVIRAA